MRVQAALAAAAAGGGGAASPAGGISAPTLCSTLGLGDMPLSKVTLNSPFPQQSISHREGSCGLWDVGWGSLRPRLRDHGLGEAARGQWPRGRPGTQPCSAAAPSGADQRLLLERQSESPDRASSRARAKPPLCPTPSPARSARHTQHTRDTGLCYTGPS